MDIVIIAHFVTNFDETSRFICIAEYLSKQHQVELITSTFDHIKKQQRKETIFDLKTKITLLQEPSYKKNISVKRFLSHRHFGTQVKKYLKNRKTPDVVYCAVPSLDCSNYAAKYAHSKNIKFIIDVQDIWPEAFKLAFNIPIISDIAFYPMKRKADHIYSSANTIVGVSETYCKRAKSVNKNNAECIPVYLGTNLELFDKYSSENKIARDDDKFIIGYCGTLGHSYDIKCILDALAEVRERGYNVSFWIMGDGPLKSKFEQYAKKHDLDVVFYGHLPYDKMCALLVSCDACVNPIAKGATQSIINKHADYAASALPVINTQESTEYREMIEKYDCGINCECSDHRDVADAIIMLINNKEERIAMGKRSRKMAEELFDRNKSYSKIYSLFD